MVDLNVLIEESLSLAYHGARAQDQNFNTRLERDFDPTVKPIELVPQDITRVFLNLFGNGFYAANKRARAKADGHFRLVLRMATHDAGDAVEIRMRDNSAGIPSEIRDKLFQPFFTTKPTGEGDRGRQRRGRFSPSLWFGCRAAGGPCKRRGFHECQHLDRR